MLVRSLGIITLLILSLALAGARKPLTPEEEMRYGVEAAERGLWREALFRWERALRTDPGNARLRNNLAVAYESLGRFDRALEEYEAARRLAPDNEKILQNYESFQELQRGLPRARSGEGDSSGDGDS